MPSFLKPFVQPAPGLWGSSWGRRGARRWTGRSRSGQQPTEILKLRMKKCKNIHYWWRLWPNDLTKSDWYRHDIINYLWLVPTWYHQLSMIGTTMISPVINDWHHPDINSYLWLVPPYDITCYKWLAPPWYHQLSIIGTTMISPVI